MVFQKKIDPPWFVRYQQDGFDLDLTYVTNRVIATSFPSTGVWSLYRFLYNVQLNYACLVCLYQFRCFLS